MTTVAWDGRYLAADGRACDENGVMHSQVVDKMRLMQHGDGGWVVACAAGVRQEADEYFDWLEDGEGDQKREWPFPTAKGEWETEALEMRIILEREGPRVSDLRGRSTRGKLGNVGDSGDVRQHRALGSGAHFALGAMAAGADARRAVLIASQFDTGTGGRIQFVDTTKPQDGVMTYEVPE